jgi:hypothetical protein
MKRIIRHLNLHPAMEEADRLALQTNTVYSVHKSVYANFYDIFIGMAEFGHGTAAYTARPSALRSKVQ